MLKPDKHTDIKFSIIYLAGVIMKLIQESGIIGYDDLKGSVAEMIGSRANENFDLTLSFLFLMDKINYVKELDSLKQS